MTYKVLDNIGRPLDARLDLDGGEIVFHSRGGTRGGASSRNLDYGKALRLLLERVAFAGRHLTGVWVDSDEVRHLPRAQRSILTVPDFSAAPAVQFRLLSRNMQSFGRPPDAAYGGSRVKKIRIAGDWPSESSTITAMLGLTPDIGGPELRLGVGSAAEPALTDAPSHDHSAYSLNGLNEDHSTVFDPTSIEDGREQIVAFIKRRQGQPGFRRALLRAYGGRCAISGCAIEPLLEAAHIHPYRGPQTNRVQNGLLLRADLHTLFDLHLITISEAHTVTISAALAPTEYARFDGHALALPVRAVDRPSEPALAWHRTEQAAQNISSPVY